MESTGLEEKKIPAKKGGKIVKDARVALEEKTGRKVVSSKNYLASRLSKKKLK